MKLFVLPQQPDVVSGKENNPDLFTRTVKFAKGYSEDAFHSHANSYEFYLILSGQVTFEDQTGQTVSAGPRSLAYFSAGEPHRIIDVQSESEAFVIKRVGADKSMLNGS